MLAVVEDARANARDCSRGAARELGSGWAVPSERVRYALRYRGQSFELARGRGARSAAGRAELRERFEAAHERRYGYRDEHGEVELVTVTVSVWGPAPALAPARRAGRRSGAQSAPIVVGGGELEASLHRRRARARRARSPARRCARSPEADAAGPAGLARRGRRARHDRPAHERTGRSARVDRPDRAAGPRRARCTPPARRWARC